MEKRSQSAALVNEIDEKTLNENNENSQISSQVEEKD